LPSPCRPSPWRVCQARMGFLGRLEEPHRDLGLRNGDPVAERHPQQRARPAEKASAGTGRSRSAPRSYPCRHRAGDRPAGRG
jgi:hypothetical protein